MTKCVTKYVLIEQLKSILEVETGTQIPVSCYDDLVPYFAYIVGKDGKKAGQMMLHNVFVGEKVMADLVRVAQTRVIK